VLSILLLSPFLMGNVAQAQDFQSWNEVDLTASWHKVQFLAPFVARVDPSMPNPQLAATGLTADFPLPWHLTVTGGDLFVELPQMSTVAHVPLVAITRSWHPGRLTLADRNRFEKLYGYGTEPARYRNRLLLDRPFGRDEQWHVFADDEFFVNLSAGTWNQNRFQAGAGTRLSSRLFLDLYYLERNANGSSTTTQVLGTDLRVALTPLKGRPGKSLPGDSRH
jgi:hypothetical protein